MPSVSAQRIQGFRALINHLMRFPSGVQTDVRLFSLSQRLRTEAYFYITSSTLDLDLLAFISKEKAVGRFFDSEAHARLAFSQAGVVAPPESLKTETFQNLGQGA